MSNARKIVALHKGIEILIGFTCVVLLFKVGIDVWPEKVPAKPDPQRATYIEGKRVLELAAPATDRLPTVVLVLSPKCSWCMRSIPFYRNLLRVREEHPGFRVGAVFMRGGDMDSYLRDNDLMGIERLTVSPFNLPIKSTPTVLLADENGTVVRSWIGYLQEAQQKQVTDALVALSQAPPAK